MEERQLQWLVCTAVDGVVAGMLLWAVGAAPIARTIPESWHWPECMVANIIEMDQESAGARRIAIATPDTWGGIVRGHRIIDQNRDTITRCEIMVVKEQERVQSLVEIGRAYPKLGALR